MARNRIGRFLIFARDESIASLVKEKIVDEELRIKGFNVKVLSEYSVSSWRYDGAIVLKIYPDEDQTQNIIFDILRDNQIPFRTILLYETIPPIDVFLSDNNVVSALPKEKINNGDTEEIFKLAQFIKDIFRGFILAQWGEVPQNENLMKIMTKSIDWKVKIDDKVDDVFLMTTSMMSKDMWQVLSSFIVHARKTKNKVVSLLITGPTGSGKTALAEKIAKAIFSDKDDYLLKVNLTAIPKTLIDSALFGYRKGAFTGADEDKEGYIHASKGKVLFLDEIGEIPPSVQVKLLTYMDDASVQRVGDNTIEHIPVVLIGATNRNIEKEVETGTLRKDFVYRWDYRIDIPPLSERGRDIRFVISFLLQQDDINAKVGRKRKIEHISVEAIRYIESLPLEGNFRELKSLLRMGVNRAYVEGSKVLMLRHLVRR